MISRKIWWTENVFVKEVFVVKPLFSRNFLPWHLLFELGASQFSLQTPFFGKISSIFLPDHTKYRQNFVIRINLDQELFFCRLFRQNTSNSHVLLTIFGGFAVHFCNGDDWTSGSFLLENYSSKHFTNFLNISLFSRIFSANICFLKRNATRFLLCFDLKVTLAPRKSPNSIDFWPSAKIEWLRSPSYSRLLRQAIKG